MDFKFFEKKKDNLLLSNQFFRFQPMIEHYDNVEFCFQFDDSEPVAFANGTNEISLKITANSEGYITFTNGDKRFTIFAREIQ
jgi:hypothetical protein